MALKYLSNIDLGGLEIQNAKPFVITTADQTNLSASAHASYLGTSAAHQGQMYFNSQTKALLLWKGTGFIVLDGSGDISKIDITAGNGLTGSVTTTAGDHTQTINVVGGDGITSNANEVEVTVDGSTIELSASDGTGAVRIKDSGVVTDKINDNAVTLGKLAHQANNTVIKMSASGVPSAGTIDTANISADAVTIAKLEHRTVNHVLKYGASGVPTSGTIDTANISADAITASEIEDSAIQSEHYQDNSVLNEHLGGSIANGKLVNDGMTIGATDVSLGGTITAITGLTDLDLTSGNKTIFDTIGAHTLTMGASGTTITIPGNLVVAGTQTTLNETVKIVENNKIEFEGTTADDAHQIKLSGGEPTADREVTLPDNSGTIALTTDITARQYSATIGDGSAVAYTIANAAHGMGTDSTQFMIQLVEVSTGATIIADVTRVSSGSVTFTFAVAPASNAIRILMSKIG